MTRMLTYMSQVRDEEKVDFLSLIYAVALKKIQQEESLDHFGMSIPHIHLRFGVLISYLFHFLQIKGYYYGQVWIFERQPV